MPAIKLVAFDMGNVLSIVDEGPPIREFARLSGRTEEEVFDACYSPERKQVLESGLQSWLDFVRQVQQALGLDISEMQFKEIFNTSLTPNLPIFDVVEGVAEQHRIALSSNTSAAHWELERDRLPFGRRLDPAIVSYEVGAMKPSPAIYEALVDRSGTPPDRILFTDDMMENVEGAHRAGLHAVQFAGVQAFKADLRRFEIDV